MRHLIISILILIICSCKLNDDINNPNDFIETLKPIWATVLLDDFDFGTGIQGRTLGVNNGEVVLFNGVKNTFQTLNGLDVNTGEIIWTFEEDNVRNGNFSYYYNPSNNCFGNENIFFQSVDIGYFFNIKSGSFTKFNLNDNYSQFLLNSTCINEKYFLRQREVIENGFRTCLFYNAYSSFDDLIKLCPKLDYNKANSLNNFGGVNYYIPFKENTDILIFILYTQAVPKQYYWGLYNETDNKWIFDSVKIGNSTTAGFTEYYNRKFYVTDQTNIYCYSRKTAELLWQKEFPAQIDAMNIIEDHNKIIINCVNYTSYCINADSNTQIWQENTAASTSNIYYQDGVVYFIGGDTGKLHALDINTGKHYWKVVVPHLDGPGSSFSKHVGGMPAQNGKKGKIFTSSFTRAYCFEAVN